MFDERLKMYENIKKNLAENKYVELLVRVLNHDMLPRIPILSVRYIEYGEESNEVIMSLDKYGSNLLRVQSQHEVYVDEDEDDKFYVVTDRENESTVVIVAEK